MMIKTNYVRYSYVPLKHLKQEKCIVYDIFLFFYFKVHVFI